MLGLTNKGLSIEKIESIKQSQYDLKSTKTCHNISSTPKANSGSIAKKSFSMDGSLFARPNVCS